jgi:hypothetical protein
VAAALPAVAAAALVAAEAALVAVAAILAAVEAVALAAAAEPAVAALVEAAEVVPPNRTRPPIRAAGRVGAIPMAPAAVGPARSDPGFRRLLTSCVWLLW